MEEEKKVDLTEFHKKEKSISKRMEKCIKDIDAIKQAIYAKIKAETPQELRDKYDALNKDKEEKETERNKIALSAQKYNDKIIPLSRELMKPLLQDEYEDFDTIWIQDGQMVCTVFSHLDDFKNKFNERKK
jgi:seryl-tRNA synthetase